MFAHTEFHIFFPSFPSLWGTRVTTGGVGGVGDEGGVGGGIGTHFALALARLKNAKKQTFVMKVTAFLPLIH